MSAGRCHHDERFPFNLLGRGRMSAVNASIPVGSFPSGVAMRNRNLALGRYPIAYTANNGGDSVSVIDTAANTVLTTISGVEAATAVRVSADGARAYVLRVQGVSVIDTATNTVTAFIDHGGGLGFSLAISPDQADLYLTDSGGTVSVIDTATHAVTATIAVGAAPVDVEVSPDGAHAYVANIYDSTVSVIDTATNTVTATIAVGSSPCAVAVSPDSTRVYIANAFY